jgi:hypothetical protein
MVGNELWLSREGKQDMARGAAELLKPVNQEVRAVTGGFWTINLGALVMESDLRLATARLRTGTEIQCTTAQPLAEQ